MNHQMQITPERMNEIDAEIAAELLEENKAVALRFENPNFATYTLGQLEAMAMMPERFTPDQLLALAAEFRRRAQDVKEHELELMNYAATRS